ncbi:hypothetical protein scyTo_0007135 [Scyliorhinus torazame]|uniref:Uncharacterized protein n=1 Tax=Scyliorhinus torazame TaxID=75743 RepID=A0A401NM32_SCYTO|nr:hypothetical protein [Scyliorhinus torazame]
MKLGHRSTTISLLTQTTNSYFYFAQLEGIDHRKSLLVEDLQSEQFNHAAANDLVQKQLQVSCDKAGLRC